MPDNQNTTNAANILGAQSTPADIETPVDRKNAEPDKLPQGYVALPTENSTPEEVAAFYGKLGRPETAEKYELPVPQGLDDAFPKAMAPVLFEAGITQSQAAKLAEGWNSFITNTQAKMQEDYQKAQENEMNALRQEWGADYDKNEELARQAARKYGLTEEYLEKMERALGSKALMLFMYKIGATIMDADIKGQAGPAASVGGYSKEQAKAKLEELKADKEFGKKLFSGDKEAEKLFDKLCRIAGGI